MTAGPSENDRIVFSVPNEGVPRDEPLMWPCAHVFTKDTIALRRRHTLMPQWMTGADTTSVLRKLLSSVEPDVLYYLSSALAHLCV